MNPEHCHAFTQESLENIGALLGYRKLASMTTGNGISFVIVFEKEPEVAYA